MPLTPSFQLCIPNEHKTFIDLSAHKLCCLKPLSLNNLSETRPRSPLHLSALNFTALGPCIDLSSSAGLVSVTAPVFGCISGQSEIKCTPGRQDGGGYSFILPGKSLQTQLLPHQCLKCHTDVEICRRSKAHLKQKADGWIKECHCSLTDTFFYNQIKYTVIKHCLLLWFKLTWYF